MIKSTSCLSPTLRGILGALLLINGFSLHAQTTNSPTAESQIAEINAEMTVAIEKVKAIINQKVGAYKRVPGMRVSESSPGWFHDGAHKPDFNTVDVRKTQELPYAKHAYVSSDLNPNYAWVGSQVEFNSMTKYFYTDRTVPKKKLTEAEMLEVNQLYRIIGSCETKIRALQPRPKGDVQLETEPELPTSEPERKYEPVPKENYVKAAVGVGLVLLAYVLYRVVRK